MVISAKICLKKINTSLKDKWNWRVRKDKWSWRMLKEMVERQWRTYKKIPADWMVEIKWMVKSENKEEWCLA